MIAKDLQFERGSFTLGPISFDFSQPGLYFICGRNGSGKTSLLKILCGRLRPKAGQLSISAAPLGTVGVESLFPGSWTISEINEWYESLSGAKQMHREFLERTQIKANRKLQSLSAGQKRAVELAIVLGTNLETYLLDEAFQNLDRDWTDFFKAALKTRLEEGARVVMSIHHPDEQNAFSVRAQGVLQI